MKQSIVLAVRKIAKCNQPNINHFLYNIILIIIIIRLLSFYYYYYYSTGYIERYQKRRAQERLVLSLYYTFLNIILLSKNDVKCSSRIIIYF